MTKGNSQLRSLALPPLASSLILEKRRRQHGGRTCPAKKKNCTILAAQRTSIARLMTTITSSGADPQRHHRIPSPLRRSTDRNFLRIRKSMSKPDSIGYLRRWKDPRQQERRNRTRVKTLIFQGIQTSKGQRVTVFTEHQGSCE